MQNLKKKGKEMAEMKLFTKKWSHRCRKQIYWKEEKTGRLELTYTQYYIYIYTHTHTHTHYI